MGMTYEAFVEAIRQDILENTGLSKENVFFEEKGGRYGNGGDRLYIQFEETEENRELCGLYVSELYELYQDGKSVHSLTCKILDEIEHIQGLGYIDNIRKIGSYEDVVKSLFVRVINWDKHKEELAECIYRQIGDVALVLYMKVGEDDGCLVSFKIRRDYLERWKVDEIEIFETAMENTKQLANPRIYFWEKMLYDEYYTGEEFLEKDLTLNQDAIGNCLSTTAKTNGAIAVFLPGVAYRLGELMDADFYMVFTSIHEVMIHDDRLVDAQTLREILKDTIKEATLPEDYLTSKVYHYNRKERMITCIG
ncbi:MAG: hypothetical protein HUJ72_10980 [Blautia sp.]|nr:hypothetical protein [Blautia sp.]